MKINAVNLIQYNRHKGYVSAPKSSADSDLPTLPNGLSNTYPAVYFTGKINNINDEKTNLLRQLDEILKEDVQDDEEINETELKFKAFKVLISMKKQLDNLYAEAELIWQDRIMNPQQKYSRVKQIQNEAKRMQKLFESGTFFVVKQNKYVEDEKTDYVLINKFKSAVSDENFDLKKVFADYYKPLNDINSLKELKEKYPKIHIPQRPEDVIARKLENTITRDFYEDLYDAFEENDKNKAKELLSSKVMQLLNDNIKIKSEEEKDNAYKKLIGPTLKAITVKYYKLHNADSFTSVPEFRKKNKNLLSENDIKLLEVDYDDFVLTVLKEQYKNLKKPNEIVYTKDGKTIKVSSLKEPEYKFDRVPGRIISLMNNAQEVRTAQRDYKRYTTENFRKKLEFYAGKFDESEILLNTIVQFDSCRFEKDDIDMLIKFLQAADKVWDGEKTVKEFEEYVFFNSIKPIHTERMNELEQQQRLDAMKAEGKKLSALHNIQEDFDSHINILYANNLNYLAELCSKYKPESLDDRQIELANILTGVIDKNIHGQNIKNKEKFENQIVRITNYLSYLTTNSDSEILKKAQNYARKKDGTVDIEKAGKYLLNSEFIQNYPQSLNFASNKEIAKRIVENANKEKAVEYLCKYDDYTDLTPNEKTKISNILNIFDIKNSTEKSVLKTIIEEDYITTDTSSVAKLTEDGSKKAKTTMGKNAKSQIYDHYKFPKCLVYFDAFEDALTHFAASKNSAGIKKVIGTKDTNELKIKGHDDRLIAYNNTYYFDEFSINGLH